MFKKSLMCFLVAGAVLGGVSTPAMSAAKSVRTASKLDRLLAPIKSSHDLDRYLAVTPEYQSAFSPLTPAGRRAFIESLTFNQNGLTGFSYRDLQAELTPTQIDKLLALFGARNTIALMQPARLVSVKDRKLIAARGSDRCGSSECDEDGGGYFGDDPGGSGWDDGGDTTEPPPPPPTPDPADTTDKDVAGYACTAHATCEVKNFSICRKGC